MKKFYALFLLSLFALATRAQTQTDPPPVPTVEPYGKIDKADLEMTSCDFEKDANAEVLFDQGSVYFDANYDLVFDRHTRVKIFNDNGKNEATIRIMYFGGNAAEYMSDVQAETINLNNGNIEITKIDKKLIYKERIDRARTALAFSFPDVKPGSVVEFKYTLTSKYLEDFPDWYFQTDIPTRYSELKTDIPNILYYKNLVMVNQPFVKNTADTKAMADIPSLKDEPYMSSRKDNAERILYQLTNISVGTLFKNFSDTWEKVGKEEVDFDDFGAQFRRKLKGEEEIIDTAKRLTSAPEKIDYIFNVVKNTMKWDKEDEPYTDDGTSEAWAKRTGNSTEINLILCHLLTKSGINALPMLVSTRENGKVNPAYPSRFQFDRTVAYIPIDSTNYYVLDATDKYNIYNETPPGLLDGFGFYIDKENQKYDLVFLHKKAPARRIVLINAEIKPDSKVNGTAQISCLSYNRIDAVKRYKTDGEKKYIEYMEGGDNNLKISSVKFENLDVDTVPLTQNIAFDLDLNGSDENYIYFKPALFSGLGPNPFLTEERKTDIDFGCRKDYLINGTYKLPAGYTIDALPKSISMAMPDTSIVFRRLIEQQGASVMVSYTIDFRKTLYFKEYYPEIFEFYKKMYEMLNEPIVLKKI